MFLVGRYYRADRRNDDKYKQLTKKPKTFQDKPMFRFRLGKKKNCYQDINDTAAFNTTQTSPTNRSYTPSSHAFIKCNTNLIYS